MLGSSTVAWNDPVGRQEAMRKANGWVVDATTLEMLRTVGMPRTVGWNLFAGKRVAGTSLKMAVGSWDVLL